LTVALVAETIMTFWFLPAALLAVATLWIMDGKDRGPRVEPWIEARLNSGREDRSQHPASRSSSGSARFRSTADTKATLTPFVRSGTR
jgi:hypothetical protein